MSKSYQLRDTVFFMNMIFDSYVCKCITYFFLKSKIFNVAGWFWVATIISTGQEKLVWLISSPFE